ncbi:hypothetical protein F5Y10DRAFT_267724 [Nemania abortiva]|nr:hypothetical protein F5Y10DRAFT_267724 [Nemania abortiva]
MRYIGHLVDISQSELLALLDYYYDPSLPLLIHEQAQILMGLDTVSAVLTKKVGLHHMIYRPLFWQLFWMDTQSTSAQKELVVDHGSETAHMQELKVEDMNISLPISVCGMDSLMAIDLKN